MDKQNNKLNFIDRFLCRFISHKGEWTSLTHCFQNQRYDHRICERCGEHEYKNERRIQSKSIIELERIKKNNPNKYFDSYGEEVEKEDDHLEMINRMNAKINKY